MADAINPGLDILDKPDLSDEDAENMATQYWEATQKGIAKLEENLQAKLLVLYFSARSGMVSSDVDFIFRQVVQMGHQTRLAVLLYGPGGSIAAAARIAFFLRKYCDELIFVIPSEASSACTILALSGDKILMGPLSMLSPIDTSIAYHPLAPKGNDDYPVSIEVTEIQKFIELCNSTMATEKVTSINDSPYGLLSQYVHPVVLGAIQRSLSLSKLITTDVLKLHMKDEARITQIVDELNDSFPMHNYPIALEKAQQLNIQAESMDDSTHTIATELLANMYALSSVSDDEREDIRFILSADTVFEIAGCRTVFFSENRYNIIDGKWEFITKKADYYTYKSHKDKQGKLRLKQATL